MANSHYGDTYRDNAFRVMEGEAKIANMAKRLAELAAAKPEPQDGMCAQMRLACLQVAKEKLYEPSASELVEYADTLASFVLSSKAKG